MSENNNLVFKTFNEAKRHLIANPGGSIVRSDSNDSFYIKLPYKNVDTEPQLPKMQEKTRNVDKLYTKDELYDLAKDSISQAKVKEIKQEKEQLKQTRKQIDEVLNKYKTKTKNYNKKPLKTSYPKGKKKIAKPDFKQYVDEPLGTRESFKSMSGKQHFGNKTGNH